MSTKTEATIEDLYRIPENGKAEIVNGELVLMAATGFLPGRAAGEVYASLREYERCTKHGAPIFAVEVRSENDYGLAAEETITAKRADYFAAGTLVVWDVDVLKQEVVRVYRASTPEQPQVYQRGEVAEAEPAVPGWSMPVDHLFTGHE